MKNTFSPSSCSNPSILFSMALIDTGTNVSLLGALALAPVTNNLVSVSILCDAGCEVPFTKFSGTLDNGYHRSSPYHGYSGPTLGPLMARAAQEFQVGFFATSSSNGTRPCSNPMCYCRSHGYKYKHRHSSAICNKEKTGHQVTAKRGDIQGGTIWNQNCKP